MCLNYIKLGTHIRNHSVSLVSEIQTSKDFFSICIEIYRKKRSRIYLGFVSYAGAISTANMK